MMTIVGAEAPTLVTNDLVARMEPGSVLVDIAVDQGGCFEDTRPTTHQEPTYKVHKTIFYCVANMPGAVPNTSTYALTNVTLPYAVSLANQGVKAAFDRDPAVAAGHDIAGHVAHHSVSEPHNLPLVAGWHELFATWSPTEPSTHQTQEGCS